MNPSKKPISRRLLDMLWPTGVLYGGLFVALGVLLYWRLGSLLPGYSASEALTYHNSLSLQNILDNPLSAPFSLLTHGLTYLSDHSYLLTRLAATLFGLGTLALFCLLVHRWYGTRTAIAGTILFGTSAWFLHTARLGTPDVLLFGLLALVACGLWLKRTNNPFVLLLCFMLAAAALYVPGMVWLIAFVIFWEWKQIDFLFKRHLWAVALGALLFLAAASPLAWALYRTPELAKTFVGLPAEGWPSVMNVLQNALEVPLALFVRAPTNAEVWLANVPVLDVFAAGMFVLGAYLYLKHNRLSRAKIFTPILLVGWLLVALGGQVTLSLIVPFIYIVVSAGVGFMYDHWRSVFPRNPIAKGIGFALISVAIATACSFQLRHYFLAWPNNTQTREVFTIQEAIVSDTINR